MKRYAVIVAGGSGTRVGGEIPKQFRRLNRRPMLWWSLKAFHDEDPSTEIIVVLPEAYIALWEAYINELPEDERIPHSITAGGTTRKESVERGLMLTDDSDSLIAVHDGARPLVGRSIIARGWEKALECGAAIPVIPVTDSLRKLDESGSHAVDRSAYVAVQTPQVFSGPLLKEAYANSGTGSFTDDASVVEHYGHKISIFEGSDGNFKVTNPKDLAIAELMMTESEMSE